MPRRGMSQFVGLADNEILESEPRIEARRAWPVLAGLADRGGFYRRQADLRSGFGGAVGDRRLGRANRRHNHRDPRDLPVLCPPQLQNAVCIIGRDPIAVKSGRRGDDRLTALDPMHGDRRQPAAISDVANLFAEPFDNMVPFAFRGLHRGFGTTFSSCFDQHHIPPICKAAPSGQTRRLNPTLQMATTSRRICFVGK